jgi:hypothetical protein
MSLQGKWVGQYTYGNDYLLADIGRSVPFEMNLVASGIEFYGNFSDDESRYIFHDEGVVAGFVEGSYICFDKQYPKAWQMNGAGVIEVLEDSIPPVIKYEGTLGNGQFQGTWEIHEYYKEEEGDIFSMVVGTGTWSISVPVGPS